MARKHLRDREKGWRSGLVVNGAGAATTGVVTVVIGIFKFTGGAWFIMLLVPVLVAVLVRLNKQYESEERELKVEARRVSSMALRRAHSVIVLVGDLDRSTARALQYARTLTPDTLRAVHVAADELHAEELVRRWAELGLDRVPLEIVECPNRRINRALLELAVSETSDPRVELTVLVPRRQYARSWHRLLHDRTSDSMARTLADVPHANVTFVPYHLGEPVADEDVDVAGP
jgi:hypothetical protein